MMFATLLALAHLSIAFPAECTEPGKLLWGLKSNIPKPSSIAKAKFVRFSELMRLPYPDPMPKRNLPTRDRVALIANPNGVKEGDMIRTRGWLRLIATEDNDCEYHLQLTQTKASKNSVIIEVSKDDATSIKSAFVRGKAKTVRAFIRDEANGGEEPPEGGKVLDPPIYVEVAGQLFLDSAHGKNDKRGKGGMPAATLWEIHPVLAIKHGTAPP
jgi:hypothetical protein